MKKGILKSSLTVLLIGIAPLFINAHQNCSGSCPSGCISWSISYETDCNCNVTTYESVHYMGDVGPFPIYIYRNSESNPEFLGMNAANLGCSCDVCG